MNKVRVPVLPFFTFLSFSLPFSAAKHPFDDGKSKDGWLDLFLLKKEGYLATILRYTFDSPVFHAADFGILVSKFATLGLKPFDVLSLANTLLAFRDQCILSLDTLISISCHLRATGGR